MRSLHYGRRVLIVGLGMLATLTSVACDDDAVPPVIPADTDRVGTPPDVANRPPQLYKIGERFVALGETLVIEPRASDADGDSLSYFVQPLPKGATFQKSPPRFEWTPTELQTVSPTFVVSDGEETDRETVQIQVVTEVQNHTPVLQLVGDQALEVGESFTLQLQASDADGDPITFAVNELPVGASLDASTGLFGWIAPPALEGTSPTLTFTVSDGQAETQQDVRFYVLAPGQNKPPEFSPLSPQVATVGEPYSLTLSATDPDGDTIQYGLQGSPPTGAAFDPTTARFTWTPLEGQAGETWEIRFSATDGTYTVYQVVDIEVTTPSIGPSSCEDDPGEPNNDPELATPINAGNYDELWLCDSETSPIDEDWYSLSLAAGQTLSVTLGFDHDLGDIDVALYKASDLSAAVAVADSATDDEVLSYVTPQLGVYLLRVFGIGQSQFESPYVLEISTSGLDCNDDDWEPNDNPSEAAPISPGAPIEGAMFCPADVDWWEVPMTCGSKLAAQLSLDETKGALALSAYRASAPEIEVGTPGGDGAKNALFYTAPKNETVLLRVEGSPPESTLNGYGLLAQVTGTATCSDDDQEPNEDKLTATQLEAPIAELSGMSLCCNEDWYFVPMMAGSGMLATVSYDAGANVQAEIYSLDGDTALATAEPDAGGLILELNPAPFSGNFYIRVEGDPGTTYDLEMVVIDAEGCATSKGCEENEICWKTTGICLSDYCVDESDCPVGQEMPCVANQCLDGCTYDAECKIGWSCKGFDFGRYCGPNGDGVTGAECDTFADCKGSTACGFQEAGGYCTNYGCSSNQFCPGDASCVQYDEGTLCAANCTSNSDCRTDDGHTCQPKKLVNNLDVNVCLPAL